MQLKVFVIPIKNVGTAETEIKALLRGLGKLCVTMHNVICIYA